MSVANHTPPTPLLTPDEVADLLRITPAHVRHMLRTGELPGIKLGRLWRIRPSALDDLDTTRRAA